MDDNEVIAVLVAGYDDEGVERATVILRDACGNVSMKQMDIDDTAVRRASNDAWFRRGRPILDPASREVVGYQLEKVVAQH